MKLLRLQINNQFRSLPAGFAIEFRKPDKEFEKNLHEPICLVGVNGSGKSNVLEALAEIFSYLDQTFLNFVLHHSDSPIINSFELEYMLPIQPGRFFTWLKLPLSLDRKYIRIKIKKLDDAKPFFYWIDDDACHQIVSDDFTNVLPDRVIGYSSGQNEQLSIPFYRVRFRYYNTLLHEQKNIYNDNVEYSRLKYIDYEENASIILANYLMDRHEEVKIFGEKLFIEDIADFEITINKNQKKRSVLKIGKDIQKLLDFLKSNASTSENISEGVEKLSFIVTQALKTAFQSHFLDASGLYTLFKRLGYLNLNHLKKTHIDALLVSNQSIYDNYKIADYTPEKRLFKISAINIKKKDVTYPIDYRSLSDGEHQFLQIVGTLKMMKDESSLFLFDEPETHFNPRWKYEYTEIFKKVTSETKSQILLTTHDPVLLSGLAKENVIVFNRPQEDIERTYKPDKDLRGMGVDAVLMSRIFGFDSTIDLATKEEMVELRTLQTKRASSQLTENEQTLYLTLYEKLKGIDFAEPLNDPMYRDFLIAKESLSVYSKPFLTEEEETARTKVSIEILRKIKEKFNQ